MFIRRLRLKKLLSFKDSEVELRQLNVLIGPNAVGKSNLIEAVSLLQAAPTNLETAIRRGGGIRQWLWLGEVAPTATVECELGGAGGPAGGPGACLIVYELQVAGDAGLYSIRSEQLAKVNPAADSDTCFSPLGT
jgi:hypothetical protein